MPTKKDRSNITLPRPLFERVQGLAEKRSPKVSANALAVHYVTTGVAADEAKKTK